MGSARIPAHVTAVTCAAAIVVLEHALEVSRDDDERASLTHALEVLRSREVAT